jgi:cytoskeletal protein RodZ
MLGGVPLSRLFATALWIVVTAASTGIVWMATSAVAADVTDRPASVLANSDVVDELESASSSATTTATSVAPVVEGPVSTVPTAGPVPVPAPNPPLPPLPTPPTVQPGVPTAPISPPTTAAAAPNTPAETRPASPAVPPPAPRRTATYSTNGGVVGVACNGFFIELVSAIPSNGYAVDVVASGPGNVDVRFVGRGENLSVKAFCFGEPIRYYEQDSSPGRAPGPADPDN